MWRSEEPEESPRSPGSRAGSPFDADGRSALRSAQSQRSRSGDADRPASRPGGTRSRHRAAVLHSVRLQRENSLGDEIRGMAQLKESIRKIGSVQELSARPPFMYLPADTMYLPA